MRTMNRIRGVVRRFPRMMAESGEGFTLIELIVVIAILGILIAIAVPTIRGFLESSKEQAYEADRRVIQLAVDAYSFSPRNERFNNDRQYPIMGKRYQDPPPDEQNWEETYARLYLDKCDGDAYIQPIEFAYDESYEVANTGVPSHPVLGTRGGKPVWMEGDGVSNDTVRNNPPQKNEKLYCPIGASPEERTDHWLADVWARDGSSRCDPNSIESGCVVIDSRDYFIDFCELVWKGFIEEIPRSASADHDHKCAGPGSADTSEPTPEAGERGSYTWYVDAEDKVESLYYFYPSQDRTGYRDVYP